MRALGGLALAISVAWSGRANGTARAKTKLPDANVVARREPEPRKAATRRNGAACPTLAFRRSRSGFLSRAPSRAASGSSARPA